MDVRRVQITGGSSFMITLPKEWTNSVGLKKNDTVNVHVQPNGSLLLYPKDSVPTFRRCTKIVDATNVEDCDYLYRQLVGAYIAGHSSILIQSENRLSGAVVSTVNNLINTSMGFETYEADDKHILLTDILEHDALDLKKLIERMATLIKGMTCDVYEAAFTGNLENVTDMKSRDKEINRKYWLMFRQCNIFQKDIVVSHKVSLSMSERTACLSLGRILEAIGDRMVITSDSLKAIADRHGVCKIDEDTYRFGLETIDLLMTTIKSWMEKDMPLAERSLKEAKDVIEQCVKDSRSITAAECGSAAVRELVMLSSERVATYCLAIAEYTFNSAME